MIDFRYHLVSIIAVFFALAVGIVLGAGPLGERVDADLPDQLNSMREQNSQLQEQIRGLESIQEYRDGFIEAVAPDVVDGRLADREIAVLAMPNADGDIVEAVGDVLDQSGASVTATVRLGESWADPESESALDALAAGLVSSGTSLPEDGDGYDRGAALLAQAFLVSPREQALEQGLPPDLDERTLRASRQIDQEIMVGLTEAEFISVEGEPERKADLAVVIAGPLTSEEAVTPAEPLVTVVQALDEAGSGAVVAGPPFDNDGELIPAIRSDGDLTEQVSTVDSADLLVGRIAVVFAVLEQESGGAGQYGYSGPDGAMPPIPDRPQRSEQPVDETPADDTDGGAEDTEGGPDSDSEDGEG
ncbi:MAG TPA: copper transporter [Jiangellaceae bacterium]|nr:copper transporter [Jiangellaceae bacterium]